MGDSCPASGQGSMPPSQNSAASQTNKKRKRGDYVDCAIHAYHPIDSPPRLLSREPPSLHPPVGHFPQRLGYPSQQSSPPHGSISYTVQNNNNSHNPLSWSVPGQVNRPAFYHNSFPQTRPSPPAPIPGRSSAVSQSNFAPNLLIQSIPVQHDTPFLQNNNSSQNLLLAAPLGLRQRPVALHNGFTQTPPIPPVQVQVNSTTVQSSNYPQTSLIPPVPGGVQDNGTANMVYNDAVHQNLLPVPVPVGRNNSVQHSPISPPPSGIQGSWSMVFDHNLPSNPLIAPVSIRNNWPFNADGHQFDVPNNIIPLDETDIGVGQNDRLADGPTDKQPPSHNALGYMDPIRNNQAREQSMQPDDVRTHQDREVPQDFPLGAEIQASPSPDIEEPQVLAIPSEPTASQNEHLYMCNIPGCSQHTLAQTSRSSKCRDHLENPPPRSREAVLAEAVRAGHGFCSGCNGLRLRRAPGKSCWECLCKNWRQRLGVFDGCPASWCPNRVIEDSRLPRLHYRPVPKNSRKPILPRTVTAHVSTSDLVDVSAVFGRSTLAIRVRRGS